MKKLLFLGIGSALAFTMGGVGPAQADAGPHISNASAAGQTGIVIATAGAGKCASCHRAHTAKATYLLKQAQPALCYSCHGGGLGATTDVQFGTSNGTGALRGGGFETAKIGSGGATKDNDVQKPYGIPGKNQVIPVLGVVAPTTSRHEISGTASGVVWGNGADGSGVGKSLTLECGSCHDPHGNGNYRTLRPIPVDSGYASHEIKAAVAYKAAVVADPSANPPVAGSAEVLAAPAVMTPVTGIKIPDTTAKVYTTTNYWLSGDINVAPDTTALITGLKSKDANGVVIEPDGYIANVANWCTTCHTRYLAKTGSYKTDSGDPTFRYKHRSDANYKAGAANCITCHVSHGSNAKMEGKALDVALPGAPVDANGDAVTKSPDSKLLRIDNRGICIMCHNV